MKISADMLLRSLGVNFTFASFGNKSAELDFERPLLLRDGNNLTNNQIYIAEESLLASTTFDTRVHSVLLYIGYNPEEYIRYFDVVSVFRNVSIFDLYDAVQNIFSEYENWDNELRRILNEERDIQEMLDCSNHIFQNPLILYNKEFSTLAFSKKYPENILFPALETGGIPSGMLKFSDMDYSRFRSTALSPHASGVRSLYINITLPGFSQYRLIALELTRKFNLSDIPLLERLADMIQLALTKSGSDQGDSSDAFTQMLKDILRERDTDTFYTDHRFSEFGWKREHEKLCIKFESPDPKNSKNAAALRLRELMPGACVFEYDNSVMVLLNRTLNPSRVFADPRLALLMEELDLKGGSSAAFSEFGELKQRFKQAEKALELADKVKPGVRFANFQEIASYMLLDNCVKDLPATMVCAPEILKLKKYDDEHNTMYYHTLYIFLKNNLRPVQTIKELYIHRSTLIYRLERIQKITGLDLERSDNQWYFMLSFKILEHADAFHSGEDREGTESPPEA